MPKKRLNNFNTKRGFFKEKNFIQKVAKRKNIKETFFTQKSEK